MILFVSFFHQTLNHHLAQQHLQNQTHYTNGQDVLYSINNRPFAPFCFYGTVMMDDGEHISGEIASNRPMYSIMSNWLLFQKEKITFYLKNSSVYPVLKKNGLKSLKPACTIYICKPDQGFELLTILFKQISTIPPQKNIKKEEKEIHH